MPSNQFILCHPLLLLPSIFPSIRELSIESVLHIRWPKYGSFSFSISPSNEYPELISFRMEWLDLLAVQGTLTSPLQHHSSKASILRHSAFFIVQLSHPFMTPGKIVALTRWTFVSKVMSLLFNMLSRLAIAFLPRSQHLLISWLQSPSAVILELKKIKPVIVSIVPPSICNEVQSWSMQVRKQQTGHGTTDWFPIGKGVHQGCVLPPAYLTYIQSTSWETLDWKKHKLESRLPGEISINSDMQMTTNLMAEVKRN